MSIEVFPLPPSGPSLAEITSAITSNAAPSTVTMPAITSSIATNAASSGVTMAAINSAITTNAAPASVTMAAVTSSITTNAASSGVTLAAIGTQVANNASPFGGTWALISETAFNNAQNITVSGLSAYKYLHFTLHCFNTQTNDINVRFNGNSNSIYQYINTITPDGVAPTRAASASFFPIAQYGQDSNTEMVAFFEVRGAQGASHKLFKGTSSYPAGGVTLAQITEGLFRSTSGISSVTIATSRANNNGVLRIQGAN